jgi:hypothetical protein
MENEIDMTLSGLFRMDTDKDGYVKGVSIDGIDITTILKRLEGKKCKIYISNNTTEVNEK